MMQFINWRLRVTISDTRQLVGTFLAFDRHMNLVLADTDEYRKIKNKKGGEEREEKRALGMILLRGENVISLSAEAPPAPKPKAQVLSTQQKSITTTGTAVPAGRGMGVTPISAPPVPVRGMGGPAANVMMPQGRHFRR
jgi:small nuclear ribonucleoprotein B and B'